MPYKLQFRRNSCYFEIVSDSEETLVKLFDGKIYPLRKLSDEEHQEISNLLDSMAISYDEWV